MKKLWSSYRAGRLALGIAVALGCVLGNGGVYASEYTAPVTGNQADETYADAITAVGSNSTTYTFTEDSSINVDSAKNDNITVIKKDDKEYSVISAINNNTDGIAYEYIKAPDNKLTLNVKASDDVIGSGILLKAGKSGRVELATVKNLEINVTGDESNTQKSYGIWNAVTESSAPALKIESSGVKINVDNANGGYGIAISAPEDVELDSISKSTTVTIYSPLDITVSGNKNAVDVLDNSAGLLVGVDRTSVEVQGRTNINVAGNGIVVTPNGTKQTQTIRMQKGGKIITTAANDEAEHYSIYNQNGTIYFGASNISGLNSYGGAVATSAGSQVDGDIYIGDNSKNLFYLGLSGADAYLKGVIKEAGAFSNVTMVLNDGAVWYNSATNKGNIGTNTKLNALNGINGTIVQAADSGSITIDKLDTKMLNISYTHDKSDPSKILGGDVTINKANEDSSVNVFTDYDDNLNTAESRENTLNALANKLYYAGYVSGERNLNGTVSIAEGLTSSSVTKYFADMKFDESTGQGYLGDNKVYEYVQPAEQEKDEFTTAIIGDMTKVKEYEDAGVYSNGKFNFTKDTVINAEKNKVVAGPWLYNFSAGIFSGYNNETVNIDLNGHDLNLNIETDISTTGIAAVGSTGKVEIFNPGAMSINTVSTTGGQTAAVFVNGGGQLFIHNGGDNVKDKVLKLRASTTNSTNGAVIKSMNGAAGERSWLKIDGLVDIEADTTDGVGMSEGISAVASTIDVGGGRIIMTESGTNPGLNFGGGASNAAIRAYGEFVTQNYGIVNVNVIKDEDSSTGNAIAADNNVTQIVGNFTTVGGMGTKGKINVGLNTADSYWIGNYVTGAGWGVTPGDYGVVSLFMGNQAKWMGYASYATNLLMDSGATWTGYSLNNAVRATIKNGATWYNVNDTAANTTLSSLTGGSSEAEAGFIDMTHDNVSDTIIGDYAGHMNVIYKHDAEDPTNILGGNLTIKKAAEGSAITLTTDNSGFDVHEADKTIDVLGSLAKKLYYNGAIIDEDGKAENNLNGYVQIAEGLTAASAGIKIADLEFSAEDGQGSLIASTIHTPDPKIVYGSSETAMMKGAKTAMASSALMWRAENNDLMKRMGDLRLSDGEHGIWAKYYGGKYEMDSQNTDLNLKYNAYQVGFDKKVGNGWTVGVAASHNNGDSNYSNGKADLTGTSFGVYGSWLGNDGQYVDLMAKYSRLENEFDVKNAYGHNLNGDYKTKGASISAEYGKRFEGSNGFYVDPSVELTLGRIDSKNYTAKSDYLDTWGKSKDLEVQQDAFTSLIGRLGLRMGQKSDNASYFAKVALAHEFNGEFDTTFRAAGEPEGKTSIDFGDTWWEAQVGGTAKLSDNALLYASFERSFGGDVEEKWRVDAGLRFSF